MITPNPYIVDMRLLLCLLLTSFGLCAQSANPTRFEAEVDAFERADAENPPPDRPIVFTGSSSVRMWKSLPDDFPDRPVINRGFGGSTFPDLIHYADRLIFAYDPSAVYVYEGDNDINAGYTPAEVLRFAERLRTMIADSLGPVPVYFISPKPSVARWQLKAEYELTNALLETYAAHTDHTFYVDVWNPVLAADGEVRDDIFLGDDLHMNEKGYDVWRTVIGEALKTTGAPGRL